MSSLLRSCVDSARNIKREFSEFERLNSPENKALRTLVFYSETGIYYRYYQDYIEHILANSQLDVCYISSDSQDVVFSLGNERIHPFYIKHLLSAAFSRLDSKVLVIATPDLNHGSIKRAPDPVHHVYAFRGICSTHQTYRLGALDHYDSLLCVAPYQIAEIRKTEEIYGLRAKQLILTGYPLVDRIYREHCNYKRELKARKSSAPICLVAPTWGPSSILECCVNELIQALSQTQFEVWIRPHPEFLKRFPQKIRSIEKSANKTGNIRLQLELSSMQCLHEADILITDHSTIAVDYVLGTERPVLHIDTPTRIDNPEFKRLGIEPVENTYRDKLGARIAPSRIGEIGAVLDSLMSGSDEFVRSIPAIREQLVANWQRSAQVGGDYILSLCQKG